MYIHIYIYLHHSTLKSTMKHSHWHCNFKGVSRMWSGRSVRYMTQSYALATLVQESIFFIPALPEKPAGTVGASESEVAGSLVRDFWTAVEYGGVPKLLGWLRNRGHRLIARWGEEILLKTSGNQKTWSSISGWEQ